ncbi:MAG: DUF1254 domain-containing protein [Solirubrobacterales bacterium]|nr:DUF1254 domain-containing protein [Solirubrobacterales bacterium]
MTETRSTEAAGADLGSLAAEAFIYGFPLVFDLQEVERYTREGIGEVPATPMNEFGHASRLAGPETKFVSINNDTVYSIAMVDVSGGPVSLGVPDTAGRYYVLQFIDAWTNNFAYVGHRATGTAAADYLLAAPGWEGQAPGGTTVIRCPTAVVTVLGRWAVAGEDDMPAVRELQAQLRLTPTAAGAGIPKSDSAVPEALRFFEQLRVWMQAFPPAERDRVYQQRFQQLGLLEPHSPYLDADPALAAALTEGLARGRAGLEDALKNSPNPKQNGWDLTYHIFDYNLDFFEIGALDDERWKLPDDATRYVVRAGAARGGLWGNHGYEAAYPMIYVDADGQALDGSHSYELRFQTPPPCRAFWSVTMYDATDFFLVENPIGRYSIGDRTPGLTPNEDGSLTIALQPDQPDDPIRRANWLPTPPSPFRPLLRIYEPDDAIFNGHWQLPPIRRTA